MMKINEDEISPENCSEYELDDDLETSPKTKKRSLDEVEKSPQTDSPVKKR